MKFRSVAELLQCSVGAWICLTALFPSQNKGRYTETIKLLQI